MNCEDDYAASLLFNLNNNNAIDSFNINNTVDSITSTYPDDREIGKHETNFLNFNSN